MTARHLAQCARGLEIALANELGELGVEGLDTVAGGVLFTADRALAARAVFWLRSAVRVLEPVAVEELTRSGDLYEVLSNIAWEDLIGPDRTFAVRVAASGEVVRNRQFAALRAKDAIVDRIRSRRGRRPDVERRRPDVPVRVIVRGTRVNVFRDLAGESLHRRGHRPVQVKSPLSEAVAAGLLLLADWDRSSPLIDPMCGSGTFVLEAAALASDRAPGLGRRFAAERFPDANPELWRELRAEARARARRVLPFSLFGSDRHPGAVGIAEKTARGAGIEDLVRFAVADAATAKPPFTARAVVANPPWGGRLGTDDRDLAASWRALGTYLRRCAGAVAHVLSGDPGMTRHIGLRSSRRWPVRIARFDARWLRYEIRPAGRGAKFSLQE